MNNSIETQKLSQLIADKKQQYIKLKKYDPNSPAVAQLESEVTFLQDTVLPLLLMKTTIFYNSLNIFVTKALRKLEEGGQEIVNKTNGILLYYEFKAPPSKEATPVIAFDSNRYLYDTGLQFGAQIYGLKTRLIPIQNFTGWKQTKLTEPLKFIPPEEYIKINRHGNRPATTRTNEANCYQCSQD